MAANHSRNAPPAVNVDTRMILPASPLSPLALLLPVNRPRFYAFWRVRVHGLQPALLDLLAAAALRAPVGEGEAGDRGREPGGAPRPACVIR